MSLPEIIDRLEMRRMADGTYFAVWCPKCLRVVINQPKGANVVISEGHDDCDEPMSGGLISDCIENLKRLQ